MKQEIAFSKKTNEKEAVSELINGLHDPRSSVKLVIFFASICYDFAKLSALIKAEFPDAEVAGCSTSGEISKAGFTNNSVVLTTLSDPGVKVSGVLIPAGNKFPMIEKDNILAAMRKCDIAPGATHRDSFALTFINGLCNAEESILSLLYAIVGDENYPVIGGSAGDDLKFDTTYASLNGEIVTDGGVVVFVKTNKKFVIKKENIFKSTGKKLEIGEVKTSTRAIHTINGRPATTEYAKALGISESEIMNASLMNPFGRRLGSGGIFITSIAGVNPDKSLSMYCRVMPNSTVELLNIDNVRERMEKTVARTKEAIPNPGFVLMVNCILRTLQFEKTGDGKFLCDLYEKEYGKVVGFSSYGEQIGKVNSNQTLVVLAIEE